jgi:outer membrane protein TolC
MQWTQEGYESGKWDYLELLEAQKIVLEVQKKHADVLFDYHMHQAELARLTGEYNEYN